MINLKALLRVFAALCAVLFVFHGISASLFLLEYLPFHPAYKLTGRIMLAVVILHALIAAVYIIRNSRLKRTGIIKTRSYFRQNASYYIQRFTGAGIIVFSLLHIRAYGYTDESGFHLSPYGIMPLINQIALAVFAGIHLFLSARPLALSFRLDTAKPGGAVFTVLLIAMVIATVLVSIAAAISYYAGFR